MSRENIRTFLDLSTDHLKLSTRQWMEMRAYDTAINPAGCGRWIAGTPYGFFLYVDTDAAESHKSVKAGIVPAEDDEPDFPADLLDCMVYAHSLDVGYIMFDQDAEAIDELPCYGDGEEPQGQASAAAAPTPAADPSAPAGSAPVAQEKRCECFGDSGLHASTFGGPNGERLCDFCDHPVQDGTTDVLTAFNSMPG